MDFCFCPKSVIKVVDFISGIEIQLSDNKIQRFDFFKLQCWVSYPIPTYGYGHLVDILVSVGEIETVEMVVEGLV